jgi:hypothetical protein
VAKFDGGNSIKLKKMLNYFRKISNFVVTSHLATERL